MENLDQVALFNIAIDLDLDALLTFCSSSKRINRLICKEKEIWSYKLKKEYGIEERDNARTYYELLTRSRKDPKKYINYAMTHNLPEWLIDAMFKNMIIEKSKELENIDKRYAVYISWADQQLGFYIGKNFASQLFLSSLLGANRNERKALLEKFNKTGFVKYESADVAEKHDFPKDVYILYELPKV